MLRIRTQEMDLLADMSLLPRVLVTTALSYAYIVVLIRLSGKRTVAHMNSFDWIVSVAVGSLLARAILTPDDTVEAWIAIAALIGLQHGLTRATVARASVARVVKSEPRLVVDRGALLPHAMRAARINSAEVLAALREAGLSDLSDVGAMVLETDGGLSVIPQAAMPARGRTPDALSDLDRPSPGTRAA